MKRTVQILSLSLVAFLSACGGEDASGDAAAPGDAVSSGGRKTAEHIDHFAWVSDRIARGAQPHDEQSFADLAAAGIKTIISVDGARPDVAAAEKHGMRYVHIPFGYDGVPREQELELAKTVRELEGPFFIHCHHGKHRGPAGAVLAQMALGDMTPEQAVEELHAAGTAARYTGLYACARDFEVPSEDETKSLDFAFPATAPVPALAEAMATLDRRWDAMKLVEGSGWAAPAGHPDIAPAHEALQIRELLTEMERLDEAKAKPADFREWLAGAREASGKLEDALRASPVDAEGALGAFQLLKASCTDCHNAYRNTK
jgi:protein tyrosine phosphatase (PTP) superfamily phosphohydrolase (DUF442 family)